MGGMNDVVPQKSRKRKLRKSPFRRFWEESPEFSKIAEIG